ncbi:MAG: hypothetical protein L6Q78_07495 [Bacteroidia bacterium]|nr:hypothetical protein [Bacteroidia bacterium]
MKNPVILLTGLVLTGLASCTSQKPFQVNVAEDDVYWSKKSASDKLVMLDDVNFDKGKDHRGGGTNNEGGNAGNLSNSDSYDPSRADAAYQAWNSKRGYQTEQDQNNQQTPLSTLSDDTDGRRLGSTRTLYYDDPYYNALAPSWGWTNWYTPHMYRPGFYNWAPGWNIGFGWNSRRGWGTSIGYNWGWGGMYYADPFWGPSPYYGWGSGWGFGGGWYDPFWGPYGYNPWYSPWYGYNCWNCNPYAYGCRTCYGRNDVVTNRKFFKPREALGGTGSGSRPGSVNTGGQIGRPFQANQQGAAPNSNATPTQAGPSRPVRRDLDNGQQAGNAQDMNPARPANQNYIPVRQRPASDYSSAPDAGSPKPGGDLQRQPDGSQRYVPPRNRIIEPSQDAGSSMPSRGNYDGGNYVPARNRYTERPQAPTQDFRPRQNDAPSRPNNSAPAREYRSAPSQGYSPSALPSRSGGGSSGGSGGGGSSAPRSRPR